MNHEVRPVRPEDRRPWLELRRALWPEYPLRDLEPAVDGYLASIRQGNPEMHGLPTRALVAAADDGRILGFLEASLRPFADGCDSHPVGFIEAWYVVPEARRTGVGRALMRAAERWVREHGCREVASDALLENELAQAAHRAVGFREVERAVRYRRVLSDPGARDSEARVSETRDPGAIR